MVYPQMSSNTKYVLTNLTCYVPTICTCHGIIILTDRYIASKTGNISVTITQSVHEAFCVVHFKGEIGHSAVRELNFLPIGKLPNRNINGDFVK